MTRAKERAERPHVLERSRFLLLLVCLVGMLVILPTLSSQGHSAIGLDLALFAVLVACIWSLGKRKHVIIAGSALILPGFLAAWFANQTGHVWWLTILGLACALAFLTFTALAMLLNIVRQKNVSTDAIFGGICVYLLIAVIWAVIYEIMERAQPGSLGPLSVAANDLATGRLMSPDLIYYSVFVLSTIGPQDVHPLNGAARAWTGLEAMVGQVYLAVLIARLVGLHATRSGE